jgi:hypothetical protein
MTSIDLRESGMIAWTIRDGSLTMRAHMTIAALLQGFRNMLVCGVGVLAAWLTIRWCIALVTGKPVGQCNLESFAVLWVVCIAACVGSYAWGRARRGERLLDCGPNPAHLLFIKNSILFAIVGITGVGFGGKLGLWGGLFAISFAVYWLLMSRGRLAVHENGIWSYWNLLPWNRIQAYRWKDDTLIVQSRGSLPFLRGALPVPPECREAFAGLLAERCESI